MKAYKGFNKDMTCRGFQYEEGKEYETDKAVLCESGFHACEAPLDVFNYYPPSESVYHEVDLDDVSDQRRDDSKRAARKIKIGAEIGIPGLIKAQIEWVKSNTNITHTDPKAATAGYCGAATAGDSGAACSRGKSAVGVNGIACTRACDPRIRGGLGAIMVIARENEDLRITAWKAVVVDGETVKADTWYKLDDNGELVEVEE